MTSLTPDTVTAPAGFIVSWSVPATVELELLRSSLTAAGFSAAELAPDLKPAQLVARTSGYLAAANSGKEGGRKLSRPVSHTARQITTEEVADDKLTYTREAGITLTPDGRNVTSDNAGIQAQIPEASRTVTETRTASDLTRIVQRVVEESGSDLIPVREQGGAYFIPSGRSIITQVDTLLSGVGGSLSTFACTIGHGSAESIANVITDYLIKQIAELQTSVDELNEKGIRADVKSRRLTRVATLREKIGAYAMLISTHDAKLKSALDTAEASLLAKLGSSDDDEPAADPTTTK